MDENPPPPVTVHAFVDYRRDVELGEVAPFKATAEAIGGMPMARLIEGTAEQVAPDEVDAQGHHQRPADGLSSAWGPPD